MDRFYKMLVFFFPRRLIYWATFDGICTATTRGSLRSTVMDDITPVDLLKALEKPIANR